MRLNQVTMPALDLAASIAFYERLGLRLIVRTETYARFELPRGESTLSLHVVDGAVARAGAPQIYFECDDVDGEVRRLTAAGVTFESGPEDQRWLWREAWTRDPAGNSLCLFHAGEARRYPPWRLDGVPARSLHLVLTEDRLLLVRRALGGEPGEASRALQDEFAGYRTSLGPYDLRDVLEVLASEWPDEFRAHAEAVREFVTGGGDTLDLSSAPTGGPKQMS